jgi:hypothetical protein
MITKEEREALNKLHLIFGKPFVETREFLESLGIYAVFQYLEGNDIVIPYLGKISLTYKGDVLEKKGKKAVVQTTLALDDFLTKCIGQIEDGSKTDAEDILLNRLRAVFQKVEESN